MKHLVEVETFDVEEEVPGAKQTVVWSLIISKEQNGFYIDCISLSQTGSKSRVGDWKCSDAACGNMNFAFRQECNKCKVPRSNKAVPIQPKGIAIPKCPPNI